MNRVESLHQRKKMLKKEKRNNDERRGKKGSILKKMTSLLLVLANDAMKRKEGNERREQFIFKGKDPKNPARLETKTKNLKVTLTFSGRRNQKINK